MKNKLTETIKQKVVDFDLASNDFDVIDDYIVKDKSQKTLYHIYNYNQMNYIAEKLTDNLFLNYDGTVCESFIFEEEMFYFLKQ